MAQTVHHTRHTQRLQRHSRPRTPRRLSFRAYVKQLLWQAYFFIRYVIDQIIDFLFGLYYDSHIEKVPPTNNVLLLESAVRLAEMIRNKTRTSEEIVRVFIERSKQVNPIINAIVDERFADAITDAKRIDDEIKSGTISENHFRNKPFLGVPFTCKDSTECKGMLYTLGLVSRRRCIGQEDAEVVRRFKEAGAILIATTSVPEFCMWQETRNNVIGQTKNPYDVTKTTGGSSGGDAALIAACGSPIGLGSDIGGSIRMPAYFCGVVGHKPTLGLIPLRGVTRRSGNETQSMVAPGPICRYVEDVAPMLKVMMGEKSKLVNLDASVDVKDLKFYFVESTLDVRASPMSDECLGAVRRVVDHFNNLLRTPATSASIIDDEPAPVQQVYFDEFRYSSRLWRYAMTQEGTNYPLELGNREKTLSIWEELPRKLLGKSDFTLAAMAVLIDQILPKEKRSWSETKIKHLKEQLLDLLGENGVLIFPSYPTTAVYHFTQFLRPYNFGYWAIFNALKLPVTQVPLGLSKMGLPLGVQIVVSPNMDRNAFAVAKELERAFGGWAPFLE